MIHINTLNQITQSWINPVAYVFISGIEDARCKSKHLNKRKSVWMFYEKNEKKKKKTNPPPPQKKTYFIQN